MKNKTVSLDNFNSFFLLIPYIFLLYFVASFVIVNILNIFYPFSLENGEGLILRYASLLLNCKNIYSPIDGNNLLVGCNYPPFYIFINSVLIDLCGVRFTPGRVLSFLSTIGIGYLIYRYILIFFGDKKSAILAVMVFFSSPYINGMSIFARPHVLSVFLSFCGIHMIIHNNFADFSKKKKTILSVNFIEILAISLLILGTFTKQTAIWSSFAYYCWITIWNPRRLVYISVVFLIGVLLTHGIVNIITNGNYFAWVVHYSVGQYSLKRLYIYWIFFIKENIVITLPIILLLIVMIRILISKAVATSFSNSINNGNKFICSEHEVSRFVDLDGKKLFVVYSFFVLLSCLLVSREGASIAYFIELIAIASVWFGIGWFHLNLWLKDNKVFQCVLPLLLSILICIHFFSSFELLKPNPIFFNQKTRLRDQLVVEVLKDIKEFVLCEDQSYAILSNHEPYFVNPFIFTNMAKRGLWNPEYIIGDLQQGTVKAICINSSISHPDQLTTSRIGNKIIETAKSTHQFELEIYNRYIYFYSEVDRSNALRRLKAMNALVPHL